MDGAPLNYLVGAGSRAYPVVWLTWGVIDGERSNGVMENVPG